ncbi:MAG: glycosyltransferase family 2 protein, partial [Candidatus Binatia bacterium]
GTNMSFTRQVFDKVGFFDSRLGPGAAGFSEDTEYSIRIRNAGFRIGYTPGAIVYHELNPNRYGRAYNRMVEYRKGLSRSIYRHDSIAFRVMPNLVANSLRYGLYRIVGKSQKAYKTEGRIMKCCGYLMGKLRGVRDLDRHSQV